MINAKELRIGNYINFPHGIDVVESIPFSDDDPDEVPHYSTHYIDGHHPDALSPVELTPEILEKAGYKDGQLKLNAVDYLTFDGSNVFFTTYDTPPEWWNDRTERAYNTMQISSNLKYLHQLQNLTYAITGEELTISL